MRNDSKLLWAIMVLSALGLLTAVWLLSIHLKFSTGQAGLTESCSILPVAGHGCANIAVSNFSKFLGIPLPAIAMGYYFTIFLLVFWSWRNPQACYETLYFSFFLSTLAIPVTLLMAFIAKTQVHSFCPGCATLWVINLLVWPAFVKQLGLGWGNALSALWELIKPKELKLQWNRVKNAGIVGLICMLIFCVIGYVAEAMQLQASMFGAKDRAVKEYQEGTVVFFNADVFKGPQVKGTQDTPVMDIVEFSDLQCPACRMAAQYFRPFLMRHGNEVRFSYHNYPLDGACNAYTPNGQHAMGCTVARAAICAGDQGKFFEFHDQIFDKQDMLSSDLIQQVAKDIELNVDALNTCIADPKTETRLQKDIEWGESIKVEFTPTIVINGHKMGGAIAPAQLEALLDYIKAERAKH